MVDAGGSGRRGVGRLGPGAALVRRIMSSRTGRRMAPSLRLRPSTPCAAQVIALRTAMWKRAWPCRSGRAEGRGDGCCPCGYGHSRRCASPGGRPKAPQRRRNGIREGAAAAEGPVWKLADARRRLHSDRPGVARQAQPLQPARRDRTLPARVVIYRPNLRDNRQRPFVGCAAGAAFHSAGLPAFHRWPPDPPAMDFPGRFQSGVDSASDLAGGGQAIVWAEAANRGGPLS